MKFFVVAFWAVLVLFLATVLAEDIVVAPSASVAPTADDVETATVKSSETETLYTKNLPPPFTRKLYYDKRSPVSGSDVEILQNLMDRSEFVPLLNRLHKKGVFDRDTREGLLYFQSSHKLRYFYDNSPLTAETAKKLLELHSDDEYVDDLENKPLDEMVSYKIHISVEKDRQTLKSKAKLFDKSMTEILQFDVLTAGLPELNQFCIDGDVPTGLAESEMKCDEEGKRCTFALIKGLAGNLEFMTELRRITMTTDQTAVGQLRVSEDDFSKITGWIKQNGGDGKGLVSISKPNPQIENK